MEVLIEYVELVTVALVLTQMLKQISALQIIPSNLLAVLVTVILAFLSAAATGLPMAQYPQVALMAILAATSATGIHQLTNTGNVGKK